MNSISRSRALEPNASLLDQMFFVLLTAMTIVESTVAKVLFVAPPSQLGYAVGGDEIQNAFLEVRVQRFFD